MKHEDAWPQTHTKHPGARPASPVSLPSHLSAAVTGSSKPPPASLLHFPHRVLPFRRRHTAGRRQHPSPRAPAASSSSCLPNSFHPVPPATPLRPSPRRDVSSRRQPEFRERSGMRRVPGRCVLPRSLPPYAVAEAERHSAFSALCFLCFFPISELRSPRGTRAGSAAGSRTPSACAEEHPGQGEGPGLCRALQTPEGRLGTAVPCRAPTAAYTLYAAEAQRSKQPRRGAARGALWSFSPQADPRPPVAERPSPSRVWRQVSSCPPRVGGPRRVGRGARARWRQAVRLAPTSAEEERRAGPLRAPRSRSPPCAGQRGWGAAAPCRGSTQPKNHPMVELGR